MAALGRARLGTEDVGGAVPYPPADGLVGVMVSSLGLGLTLERADGQLCGERFVGQVPRLVVPPDECGGSPCSNRTIHRAARSGGAIPNPTVKGRDGVDNRRYSCPVTGGVDTHLDVNVAAALDGMGGLLGVEQFPTSPAGNKALLVWLKTLGAIARVGVEGTGSYGAPLARYLGGPGRGGSWSRSTARTGRNGAGKARPMSSTPSRRPERRRVNASSGQPRLETETWKPSGPWWWRNARRSPPRSRAFNQIRHLGFTAPEEIRQCLQGLTSRMVAKQAAALRPRVGSDPVVYATKTALRALGCRGAGPRCGDRPGTERSRSPSCSRRATKRCCRRSDGVGIDSAAAKLVTAGDNPDRPSCSETVMGPPVRCRPQLGLLWQGRPSTASTPAVTAKPTPLFRHIVVTRMGSSHPRTRPLRRTAQQRRPIQEGDDPGLAAAHPG